MLKRLLDKAKKCEGCAKRREWLKDQMGSVRQRALRPFNMPTPQVQGRRPPPSTSNNKN